MTGQPIKMGSGKRGNNISFYADSEQMEIVEQIRWREHLSVSNLVRKALAEYLKAHANGNSTFKLDNWSDNPEFRAVPTIMSDSETWEKYLRTCSPEELRDLKMRFAWCRIKCEELIV